MPSDDSSVRDALNHQSLQVSRDDPGCLIAAVPALSTAQPGSLVQLDEIILG